MSKRSSRRKVHVPTAFELARDELFSHILRCGELEAAEETGKSGSTTRWRIWASGTRS